MEEKELHEQIKAILEPKLKEQFFIGTKAGYDAAMLYCYRQIKDMTSAKKIIKFVKSKVDEGAARNLVEGRENE